MLNLGSVPHQIAVHVAQGYPFACVLQSESAWTEPPTLTFSDGSTWTATLDGTDAALTASTAQVAAVLDLPGRSVALSVGGMLWGMGAVVAR